MQTRQRREEKSLRIFTALALGVLLTAVCLGLLEVLDDAFAVRDDASGFVVWGAVLVAIVYLARHRRT